MLEPWALSHKRLRKKIAWKLYQRHMLDRVSVIHATSDREAENLRRLGLTTRIETIPWGVELTERMVKREKLVDKSRRTALFVGRIYPVKGLSMLVHAWAKVRPAGWVMKIVGPDEAGHRAEIELLVRQFNLESVFEFTGILEGDDLSAAYGDADLFILPSHTENFGMVVGEALAHSLPVITTQGTPWKGLTDHHCGWWSPVSVEGIAAELAEATALDDTCLRLMGERGNQWVADDFSWDRTAEQMLNLYQNAMDA